MRKILEYLELLALDLVFWKPLSWLLRLLKKMGFLRPRLCQEELRRGGFPDFDASGFITCARGGLLDKVELFLQGGIDVNAPDQGGDTALIAAAREGRAEVARLLLEQPSIEVNARNHEGESAWIAAIRSGAKEIESLLEGKRADDRGVERWRRRVALEKQGLFHADALVECCAQGRTADIRDFLVAGMEVNAPDRKGDTALIAAARWKAPEPVEVLLAQAGIDVNAPAAGGDRPLVVAAREGSREVVQRLLGHPRLGVNLPGSGGDTALIAAARLGREEVVRELLAHPSIDADARNRAGDSALVEAARRDFEAIVALLAPKCARDPDLEREVARWQLEQEGSFTAAELLRWTRARDAGRVHRLLVAGMPPDEARDEQENSPLHLATAMDDEKLVPLMLQHGAHPDARNRRGDTALILAARHGREGTVRLLLDAGADVQARNDSGESALPEAARRGFEGIVALLAGKGATEPNLERKVARWQLEAEGLWSEPQFVRAAARGDAQRVEKYRQAGMDVNSLDERRETGLIAAARGNKVEMVRLLVGWPGIDLDAPSVERDSAVEIAASRQLDEIVDLLTAAGARVKPESVAQRRIREMGLRYAPEVFVSQAARGQEAYVALFLAAGMHPNAEDDRGQTALIEAARAGHKAVVERLLSGGADPNLRDRFGVSAREVAARSGYPDVAELLAAAGGESPEPQKDRLLNAIERGDLAAVRAALAAGASPDAYTDSGRPALLAAVLADRQPVAGELLARGARADARDRDGMTALMRAAEQGRVEMMRLLLAQKGEAGLDEADPEGRTALMLAAGQGQVAAVRMLVGEGADTRARDGKGRTALIAAKTKKHAEIVEILERLGDVEDLRRADLLEAVARGDDARVAELVDQGAAGLEVADEAGNTPLALAAARGMTRSMEALLAASARPDAANGEGDTPLMLAARSGRLAVVELLLRRDDGRSLAGATNARGESALLQAAAAGRGRAVALLARSTDQPDLGAGGRTPLVETCYHGDCQAVAALIEAGANVNQQQVTLGKSPLMTAILAGQTEVVATLEENGASAGKAEAELFLKARSGDEEGLEEMGLAGVDLDASDRGGWTALMVAADEGHDGVVRILLEAKSDADRKAPDGRNTALRLAAAKGRTGVLALLLGKTRRSTSTDTGALIAAAAGGHAEAVRLLVRQAGAPANGLQKGRVPLVEAARRGHLQVVKVLLELGADPDRETGEGMTALKAALLHQHDDVVDLLRQSGGDDAGLKEVRLLMAAGKPDADEVVRLLALDDPPDLDARDEAGRTPLMLACGKGAQAVVEVLLEHYGPQRARLAAIDRDHEGRTPLMFAAAGSSPGIVSRLLALQVDVGAESKKRRTALMEACKAGRAQAVRLILAALPGADRRTAVNQQDEDGNSPLGEALLGGAPGRQREYAEIVSLLRQHGAEQGQERAEFLRAVQGCNLEAVQRLIGEVNLDQLRHDDRTPLMLAAESGCDKVAEYLIEKGADVDERGPSGVTVLMLAAGKNRRDVVRLLLERHADYDWTDDRESSALLEAVRGEHEGIVDDLLGAGANVNHKDSSGATALALAVERGNPRLVRLLLRSERKVDLEVLIGERRTALTLAHLRGRKAGISEDGLPAPGQPLPKPLLGRLAEIEALLLAAGAREGWDEAELILAIREGDSTWAQQLLARAGVNARDLDGSPPLLLACARGDLPLAEALLARRASPEVRNDAERTPLMEAAKKASRGIVEELLRAGKGLDVDAQDREGESALLEAARAGAADVVAVLLERGASVRVANRAGDTPLIAMARHAQPEAVRALLAKGANACARTARHRTAVIEAAAQGHREVLEVLLEHLKQRLARDSRKRETVVNAVDDESRTALDWADQGRYPDCAALLRGHGGKSVDDTDFVVFTTDHGGSYHIRDCSHVSRAKAEGRLTRRLLRQALREHYELCRTCRPGQAKIDWTC